MQYTSRGMRRRRNTDKWEVTLSHKDPITGEQVRSFHTIEAKTEKQAERKRDELILELERKGAAADSKMTVGEFMSMFLDYKEKAAIVEASTIRGYRHESKLVCRYIGEPRVRAQGRRFLPEGAQDDEFHAHHSAHAPHIRHPVGHEEGRHAHARGVRHRGRRPLHPGHAGTQQPALQPSAPRQGVCRLL